MQAEDVSETASEEPLNEEQCWLTVLARDSQADGSFVYAVRSTGIYCRPSCPSRRPHREKVTFFRCPETAEAASFRPCLRCHPQHADFPDPQRDLIEQVCRYIELHLDTPLPLAHLGQQVHLSPYHLQRTFKRIKGVTPHQYAELCRLSSFKARLHDGAAVTSALYDAGYTSSSSIYERPSLQLGMTPTAYRQGGKGVRIGYTVTNTDLGYVLIAATVRGAVMVCFGDTETALYADLLREYPEATLEQNDEVLQPWVTLLMNYLHGHQTKFDVPLDVHASAFQWRVWEALRAIPPGQTRSYRDIAQAIGQPTAARAVARACATNSVAVFIPCHRVVRENGQLAGYRWGLERKRRLLALEQRDEPSHNHTTIHKFGHQNA
jgi:AraC family transcriptional regulator, regulatory protein of adaptative response / methylated-DNA-[protein]-cysteine methyltransferase